MSDNAVATRSTVDFLSKALSTSTANVPISNIDNNSIVLNYLPTTTTLNNPINKNYSQHNKSDITLASITAHDKTPSRDQAIVFNSTESIPKKEYVLTIGKIVTPKNIIFVSRRCFVICDD